MPNIIEDPSGPVLTEPHEKVSETGRQAADLRHATLEGVRWITYGRVAYELVALASLAVLARFISPTQYGHVAIALIIQGLAISLTNEGFGNPLVQRKIVGNAHLESAAFMSVLFALLLGALTFLAAPLIVSPLYGSGTTHLVQLASVLFPIYGFVAVPEAILQRRMDLRQITIVETAGSFAGAMLSIGFAVAGLGGAAIILGTIAGGAVTAVALMVSVGMPRLRMHRTEAGEVTSYGAPASLAGLVFFGVRNVDNVLVGARLGATALGIYYRAFALGVGNQLKIGLVLLRVAFPSLSRADSPEQMREMRDRMTRLSATVIIPLLILLAIVAPKLVPFYLGARWTPVVVPTQILAFAGIASSLTNCAMPFLLASGRPRSVLNLNLGTLVAYVGALLIALPHGLRAVCAAVVVINVLTMLAAYGLLSRLGDVPLRRLMDDNSPAVVASAAMAAVALPLMTGLPRAGVPTLATLAAVGVAGAGAYLLALRILFRSAFNDTVLVVGRVIPGRWRPVAASEMMLAVPSASRVSTRRWLVLALALPCIGFGAAYAAGRAITSPSKPAARLSAATPKTTSVSVQTVSQLQDPAGLQVSPPRKRVKAAKARVTRPTAVAPVIASAPAPATTVATPPPSPQANPTPAPVTPPQSTPTGSPQTGTGGSGPASAGQGSGSGGSTGKGTTTGSGGSGGTGTPKPTGTGVVSGGG